MNTRFKFIIILSLAVIIYFLYSKSLPVPSNQDSSDKSELSDPSSALTNSIPEQVEPTLEKSSLPPKIDSQMTDSQVGSNEFSLEKVERQRSFAKSSLAAGYSAQKAFFAEYNRYTTDFRAMGWAPQGPELSFKMGFLEPAEPNNEATALNEDPRQMDTDFFINENVEGTEKKFQYSERVQDVRLQDYQHLCRQGCSATAQGFEMILVLPVGPANQVDIWLIDDTKTITLVQDGLASPQGK